MYFPLDEYEDRWRRVYSAMKELGFDAALIWGRSGGTYERCGDVLYLTNYYSRQSGHEPDLSPRYAPTISEPWMGIAFAAVLMAGSEDPEMVGDTIDYYPGRLPIDQDRLHWRQNVIEGTIDMLKARKIEGRLALVGSDFFPMKYFRVLETGLPQIEFVPTDDLVREIRRFKSPRELECYREAGEKVTGAHMAMMKMALRGGTQGEVAAAGSAELMRRGGVPHALLIARGGTSTLHVAEDPLLGFSHDLQMSDGDLFHAFIYGPVWQGYWMDPGRTAVVGGKPTSRQRELIEKNTEIVMQSIEAIRPGTKVVDVVRLARHMLNEAGHVETPVDRMWPIYGHGIGLFWEDPWYVSDMTNEEMEFHEGQTASVEIFLHWPDVGEALAEENFVVGKDENEILTQSDLVWW